MLSLGKLAPGQQAYYLEQVARGAEEYFTGAKEAPGQWMGAGAALLGLSGEVDADELRRVLEHGDPKTGTRFTRAQGAPKVAGFDATFCAPKSVSPWPMPSSPPSMPWRSASHPIGGTSV